jgi:hypothetical protein
MLSVAEVVAHQQLLRVGIDAVDLLLQLAGEPR